MVSVDQQDYLYTVASESDLNDLVAGREVGLKFKWPTVAKSSLLPPGSTGVVWKRISNRPDDLVKPLTLVAHEADFRRLFGRFSQLRSDFSPLTTWVHLLTPDQFDSLDSPSREPCLDGFEAAWAGVVVAEAQLLSERPLGAIRFSGCLATQSFAISRAKAVWGKIPQSEITHRFNVANKLFRNGNGIQPQQERRDRIREALQPIWASLAAALRNPSAEIDSEFRPLASSLQRLLLARQQEDSNEIERFVEPLLSSLPEAHLFTRLADLAPEQRLRVFDELLISLEAMGSSKISFRRSALTLLAGYLATVAAGGIPSLSLAENSAFQWPEITAWAYVIGGIGERVVWTSSFDGLGRLIARELMRPFRIDEPPYCDFALEEANVLVDLKLADPFVHLKIKHGQSVTVALFPGVNVSVPIPHLSTPESRPVSSASRPTESTRAIRDPLSFLAAALWPYLRSHIEEYMTSSSDDPRKPFRNKLRGQDSPKLPLKEPKK